MNIVLTPKMESMRRACMLDLFPRPYALPIHVPSLRANECPCHRLSPCRNYFRNATTVASSPKRMKESATTQMHNSTAPRTPNNRTPQNQNTPSAMPTSHQQLVIPIPPQPAPPTLNLHHQPSPHNPAVSPPPSKAPYPAPSHKQAAPPPPHPTPPPPPSSSSSSPQPPQPHPSDADSSISDPPPARSGAFGPIASRLCGGGGRGSSRWRAWR